MHAAFVADEIWGFMPEPARRSIRADRLLVCMTYLTLSGRSRIPMTCLMDWKCTIQIPAQFNITAGFSAAESSRSRS